MMRISLLAVALLSLLAIGGCAKGGNGIVPTVTLSITTPTNASAQAIYPTQTVTITAMTTTPVNAAVTWNLTGAGSILGTTPASATAAATLTYQAPNAVPAAGSQPTITATMTGSSPTVTGTLPMTVVDVTTEVAPITLSMGTGLSQQFTAVALPDYAPQTLTWSCKVGSGGQACTNFGPDPNVLGAYLYTYTSTDSCSGSGCIQISAASTLDPNGCTPNPTYCTVAAVTPVTSRVNGTYAFQFSGYDSGNNPIAMAGTFVASSSGSITSGLEEVLTSSGPLAQSPIQITGGSYAPSSSPYNSNNAGTLTLSPSGNYPYKFQVVLDGNGDLEMIESDSNGTGSGIAKISNAKKFSGTQTFAFGFTGVDSNGKRAGYVGVLPMNGSGSITGGQVDVNDAGTAGSYSSIAGTYTEDACSCGLWHVTGLALASGTTLDFDFFVASGASSKTNPLFLYAISTDTVGASHPAAVSGTMVLQDSTQTYNNAAFNGTSVSALTGVSGSSTNVSLTMASTDGNGHFVGVFDQNDAGTIISVPPSPEATCEPPLICDFSYTYTAGSSTNGRYVFQMLGNPNANPVVAPLPFVLYASGANSGFLLECNLQPPACGTNQNTDTSVMTGTMTLQETIPSPFGLSSSELPGTFAVATTVSGSSTISPIAANLFATWANPGSTTCTSECVTGTQYPGNQTMTGTFTLSAPGTGSIALTAPLTDSSTYVIYAVDTSGCKATPKNPNPVCAVQSFYMMGTCTIVAPATSCSTAPPSSILYAEE
jgi:flagellin-like hook-associated protein FlgL